MSDKTVLVVDDSLSMRTVIKDGLIEAGYSVIGEATTGEQAIDLAFELSPDIVTLDNILPDMLGLDVLKAFNKDGLASKTVLISAIQQDVIIEEGRANGAVAYIIKPFSIERLLYELKKI